MFRRKKDRSAKLGTLHVTGRGEIRVAPDIARVRLDVVTRGDTAQEAVAKNAELANAVVQRMLALDILQKNIQTTGLSVAPIYRYGEDREPVIVGYRAENAITVTVPVQRAGRVFDVGIEAGASESSGITFGLRDERRYREEAIAAAIAAARADARIVSEAMQLQVVSASEVRVEEQSGPVLAREAQALTAAATPVLPGQITLTAQVRVAYRYR